MKQLDLTLLGPDEL